MSHYAARIDDLHWGSQFNSNSLIRDALPVSQQPQLLYPSSAPPETVVVHHHQQQQPPPPHQYVPVQGTSRSDTGMMVLFALVILLCLFVMHLNSRISAMQNLLNYMSIRAGGLPQIS